MKTENWIVAFGAGILLTLIIVAIFPDDLWDDDFHYSSHAIGNTMGMAPSGQRGVLPNQLMGQQAPGYAQQPAFTQSPTGQSPTYSQQPPAVQQVAMPAGRGLVPFTAARTETFGGTVIKMHNAGANQGWGQIHVWVSQRGSGSRELSLGPGWYLEYMGCAVTSNMYVEGVGFDFANSGQASSPLYAKDVTVNGVKCRLRNDEGFALWSNRLR